MAHLHVELAQGGGAARRLRETGVDGFCGEYAAFHGQPHARGEHRIDEGVGISQHHVIAAVVALGHVGEVAGGRHVGVDLCLFQSLGQRRAGGDGVEQELFQTATGACLEVVRPGYHADAGDAIL